MFCFCCCCCFAHKLLYRTLKMQEKNACTKCNKIKKNTTKNICQNIMKMHKIHYVKEPYHSHILKVIFRDAS